MTRKRTAREQTTLTQRKKETIKKITKIETVEKILSREIREGAYYIEDRNRIILADLLSLY